LKKYILKIGQHYEKLVNNEKDWAISWAHEGIHTRYAGFLTYIALNESDLFSPTELIEFKQIIKNFSGLSVIESLNRLNHLLEGAKDKEKYWQSTLHPFVKNYLPNDKTLKTPQISRLAADLCLTGDTAFPKIFEDMKWWLGPLDDYYCIMKMSQFKTDGGWADTQPNEGDRTICQTFPKEALNFLNIIVGDKSNNGKSNNGKPNNDKYYIQKDLPECLKQIESAAPTLRDDETFKKLHQVA
ncbi:MAG: hypothetical protein ACRCTY_09145, partial [Candidatus Adiutrix sp.]